MIFGSFAGQQNYKQPVSTHPLAGILQQWAGLSRPRLQTPALLELRQMYSPKGRLVFFFNHADNPASVTFTRVMETPPSSIREITTKQKIQPTGTTLQLRAEVPPESVRIYRIDY
jgi:hypothetical protein